MSWDEWDPLVRVGRPSSRSARGAMSKFGCGSKANCTTTGAATSGRRCRCNGSMLQSMDSTLAGTARVGSVDTMSAAPAAQIAQSTTSKCSMPQLTTQTPSSRLMSCRTHSRANRSMSRQRRLPGNNRPLLISWRTSWPSLSRRTGRQLPGLIHHGRPWRRG